MIKKIAVNGYRLLDGFEADLDQLNVVIGANATGKTTLEDFLRFVSQTASRPINDAFRERGGIPSVRTASESAGPVAWTITFEKPASNPVWTPLFGSADLEYRYEASFAQIGYFAAPATERLEVRDPQRPQGESFTLLECVAGDGRVFDRAVGRLVSFDEPPATQPDLFTGLDPQAKGGPQDEAVRAGLRPRRDLAGEEPSLLLSQVRFPSVFPEVSLVRALFTSWAFYPGFSVGQESTIRFQPGDVEPTTLLLPRGENLASVLHVMLTKREYRDSAERIKDCLRSAYKDFDDLSVEAAFGAKGKVSLHWYEKGLARDLWASELSDGILRFLCLAAVLNNPLPPPLIVIDEPEVGLHPGLLPIVADMVRRASEESQVLVVTHSPDLLNSFDLGDVAVMRREAHRATWHRPRDRASLRLLLDAVEGESLGDLHRSGELEAKA